MSHKTMQDKERPNYPWTARQIRRKKHHTSLARSQARKHYVPMLPQKKEAK